MSSCAYLPYQAKPLNPQVVTQKIINKDPASAEFNAYLNKQGYSALPIKVWGLNELYDCALFFNPSLEVAKAKWAAALSAVESAQQKPAPTINGKLAHSSLKNGDVSPWSYGVGFDIPLETANKREILTEKMRFEAEIAHIEIAQTAWRLRSQIATELLNYQAAIATMRLLQEKSNVQAAIVAMLQKRFNLGMLSSVELNTATLAALNAKQAFSAEQTRLPELRAILAASVGLTSEKFNSLALAQLAPPLTDNSDIAYTLDSAELQSTALLNRLDIRAGLARYAVAESKLKLEIAKQHPDITLSPSFAFDFGDSIWSLGLSSLFNLLNKNQSLITEVNSLREVEAAQFEALQAKIIADLSIAEAAYNAANIVLAQSQQSDQAQALLNKQLQTQFNAGLIDRLTLTSATFLKLTTEQQLMESEINRLRAAYVIEDLLQHPLALNKK